MTATNKKLPLVIIGSRQTWDFIVDTADALGREVLGFLDQYYAGRVDSIDGLPCLGSELELINNPEKFSDAEFFVGNFWDGNSNLGSDVMSGYQLRLNRIKFIDDLQLPLATLVDPRSLLSRNVTFGAGTFVSRGVNIRGGARVGRHCNLLDNSGFANDVTVGNNCILSAGAYLMSNVVLGNNVYVGTRATVLNGHSAKKSQVVIGDDCKIYANELVTNDMLPRTVAALGRRLKRTDI